MGDWLDGCCGSLSIMLEKVLENVTNWDSDERAAEKKDGMFFYVRVCQCTKSHKVYDDQNPVAGVHRLLRALTTKYAKTLFYWIKWMI